VQAAKEDKDVYLDISTLGYLLSSGDFYRCEPFVSLRFQEPKYGMSFFIIIIIIVARMDGRHSILRWIQYEPAERASKATFFWLAYMSFHRGRTNPFCMSFVRMFVSHNHPRISRHGSPPNTIHHPWTADRGSVEAKCFVHFHFVPSSIMGKKDKTSRSAKEDRFAAAETRPQFRSIPKHQSKVVLDERFTSVLTDPRFQLEGKDKYGRGKKKQQVTKEELSAFYTIEEQKGEQTEKNKKSTNNDDETGSESSESDKEVTVTETPMEDHEEKKDSDNNESENEDPASRIAYLRALSRGDLDMSSSSEEDDSSQSSEDDDDDEQDGEDPVYGTAGVLDPSTKLEEEVEISYDESPYLVATNLDWENLRAVDIFAILASFAPPGAVKKVQVYQSNFGMERIAKDKINGPSDIWKRKKLGKSPAMEDDDEEEEDHNESDGHDDLEEGHESGSEVDEEGALEQGETHTYDESDFDPEKLRSYEASKLKYYFAIVEFSKSEQADVAYREVDGMEFEHSSSAIDLRSLPPEEVDGVIKDRPMRDEATSVPSNYEPPDFVVSALQQTKVQCTWDQGDVERERKLTKYCSKEWQNLSEADELRAYLASDVSSDEESVNEKAGKGSKIRKLLGLDSDDEDEEDSAKSGNASSSNSDEEGSDEEGGKTIKFVPGTKSLEEKIRNKLESKGETEEELTPWQKYQEKRKQKRKERKLLARNGGSTEPDGRSNNRRSADASEDEDDFFITNGKDSKAVTKEGQTSKRELELLLAGENDDEEARDFDIRGIQRLEKNEGKKLRGSRKRKEDKIAADVSGKGFKVNIRDERFAAVLDGADDRFGIDKTDPNYKETSAMREILAEQTQRRKKKRKKTTNETIAPNVNAEENTKSAGASALSALVQKLKTQVS